MGNRSLLSRVIDCAEAIGRATEASYLPANTNRSNRNHRSPREIVSPEVLASSLSEGMEISR